jgi:2-oxoisovalerate dehydrogenase E2 component (dihydrolipoyl transacylase)
MSLSGIARRVSELVAKARSRKLTLEDMSDGTFTVDNTGALGSVASYPIINSPQAGIITMEAIVKRPWVINDAIAIRSIINLCMSLDHRVLDGSVASRFLQSVKRRLENFTP